MRSGAEQGEGVWRGCVERVPVVLLDATAQPHCPPAQLSDFC